MKPGTDEATVAEAHAFINALAARIKARQQVFRDISTERERQEELHGPKTCADSGLPNAVKLAILTEEVGEVAKWICEHWGKVVETDDLRAELIQVAAVAVAWAESITY